MDKILKEVLATEGIQQCESVLKKDKTLLKTYPNGQNFFKGCIEGFSKGKTFFCLEQFESNLMHLKREEEELRDAIKKYEAEKPLSSNKMRKTYADVLGKRCALEYLYKNLSLTIK